MSNKVSYYTAQKLNGVRIYVGISASEFYGEVDKEIPYCWEEGGEVKVDSMTLGQLLELTLEVDK